MNLNRRPYVDQRHVLLRYRHAKTQYAALGKTDHSLCVAFRCAGRNQ